MASDGASGIAAGEAAADAAGLETAFGRFRDMLASDGYTLSWSVIGQGRVVVQIEAGPDACADCLVPLPVMEAIMSDALAPTGYALGHVVLPAQAGH
jgi:hypothetical protein